MKLYYNGGYKKLNVGNSNGGMCKIFSHFGHLVNSYQNWKYTIEI